MRWFRARLYGLPAESNTVRWLAQHAKTTADTTRASIDRDRPENADRLDDSEF